MLNELIGAGRRFMGEGMLAPVATKPKSVSWIIDCDASGAAELKGRYKPGQLRSVNAPDRQRSGQIASTNLKPYLLVDNARYALGIPKPGSEKADGLAHESFVRLVRKAYETTGDADLDQILVFLSQPVPDGIREKVSPDDVVAFQGPSGEFPFERDALRRFWAEHLAQELLAPIEATCTACGQYGRILRILPNEIVVMGQKCQITSFNQTAFKSFGRAQTTNSPLCYFCAAGATQALDYLIRSARHHVVVSRDDSKGQRYPLRNQLAIFWLKEPQRYVANGTEIDLESALAAVLREEPVQTGRGSPPPELAQLEAFLQLPWTGNESATRLSTNSFQLAVLTANKGRLMVRDWVSNGLNDLHAHLGAFVQALRIVAPDGVIVRPLTIPALTGLLKSSDANHIRGLLRTAYLGTPPQVGLLQAALLGFRDPKLFDDPRRLHASAAILKLVLTYGKEEAKRMEKLHQSRDAPAYACGRLLAILEDAQRRASSGRLNATLVERFYGSASTVPAATLGPLLSLAERAHLPKIRKENRGYARMRAMLEEVMGQFDKAEKLPRTLTLAEQAEFALGFYHQRAVFSAERPSGSRQSQEGSNP